MNKAQRVCLLLIVGLPVLAMVTHRPQCRAAVSANLEFCPSH
jgi:hypothetical protein